MGSLGTDRLALLTGGDLCRAYAPCRAGQKDVSDDINRIIRSLMGIGQANPNIEQNIKNEIISNNRQAGAKGIIDPRTGIEILLENMIKGKVLDGNSCDCPNKVAHASVPSA